ncbi:MAG: leucine-rich repeat domain-containing protein [Prevotellaceae bacterium]|nr:leucine-rich repeat domain-containing protein [Prevotellaceae bacterium]
MKLKEIKLSILAILLMIVSCGTVVAQTSETINGITYELINDNEAIVKSFGTLKDAVIPSTIKKDEKTYNIIGVCVNSPSSYPDNSTLVSVTFGENINYVGNYSFMNFKSLKKVKLNDGLVNINDNAFNSCTSLQSIVIPSNVTSIGQSAFYNSGIKTIYCNADAENAPNLGDDAFPSGSVIFVKDINKYKNGDNNWNNFEFNTISAAAIHKESTEPTYYTTFSNQFSDTELTSDDATIELELYNVKVDDGKLVLTKRGDNQVAKGEGVLVKATSNKATSNTTINVKYLDTTKEKASENQLVAMPAIGDVVKATNGKRIYRLTYKNNSAKTDLGFYLASVGETKDGSVVNCVAGKAYLEVPSETSYSKGFGIDNAETTSVDSMPIESEENTIIYNLNGQAVSNPSKGIYIKNNKKFVVK